MSMRLAAALAFALLSGEARVCGASTGARRSLAADAGLTAEKRPDAWLSESCRRLPPVAARRCRYESGYRAWSHRAACGRLAAAYDRCPAGTALESISSAPTWQDLTMTSRPIGATTADCATTQCGTSSITWGSAGRKDGQFIGIGGIAVDRSGTVFVSD